MITRTQEPIGAVLFVDPGSTKHAFVEIVGYADGSFGVARAWYETANRIRLTNALHVMARDYQAKRILTQFVIETIVGVIYPGRDPEPVFATLRNEGRMMEIADAHGLGFKAKPAPEWRKEFFGVVNPDDLEVAAAVEAFFYNPITKQVELPAILSIEKAHVYDAILGGIVAICNMLNRPLILPISVSQAMAKARIEVQLRRQKAKADGTKKEKRKPTKEKRESTSAKRAETKAKNNLRRAGVSEEALAAATVTTTTIAAGISTDVVHGNRSKRGARR